MEKILVLDFGGQYDQLIARRVREQNVYAEIRPFSRISVPEIREAGYSGIIFTGGPQSVYEESSPHCDPAIMDCGIPILGICYGAQLLTWMAGGEVSGCTDASDDTEEAGNSPAAEYGKTDLTVLESALFKDIPTTSICWMSHTDRIVRVPAGFDITAYTKACPVAAFEDAKRRLFGVQFHPEVTHTRYGTAVIRNFLFNICGCAGDWDAADSAERMIEDYREKLKGKKVLLALSGGVDSSVAAVLLHRAIGHDLSCVFVDHGLLRRNEGDVVEHVFKEKMGLNLIRVNAKQRFLRALSGVTEPEKKRKIIGEEFIRVFEEEAEKIGQTDCLAQGTIYPDVIESGKGDSAVIKSHHNVGGLPEQMRFKEIVEPLKDLFKDEVRAIGLRLGIPGDLVYRQPFPGPGLAVRIIGEITEEKTALLQEADAVYREEVERLPLADRPDQYFAVLTDTRSVGVMGDARTYGTAVVLRAVSTDDFMTAEWTRLPYEVLERAGSRIVNEIPGISRVVYDITSKPPATVEWE